MRHILLIILAFSFGFVFASEGEMAPKGKIKGAVVDKKNEQPIEYATVALYNAQTNQLVTGSITDYLGHFKIDHAEKGEYYLMITFIGLEDKQTNSFSFDGEKTVNLGNIYLTPTANELGEVEVVSRKAPVQYKIDKKVISVDKQLTAASGTAVDVLENQPSIQVDIDGNVTLRGSSGFTVLIDGKPTILDPSDALRQIPSSSIENIEIITNPSVKYEPDGATGIINIITKKSYLDGLSGLANLNIGTYGQYGGDIQLNYRVNKFNLIFGANYDKRSRPGTSTSNRETVSGDTTSFINSDGTRDRGFTRNQLRAGFEYNATKRDFFSLAARYGNWDMSHNSTLLYNNYTSVDPEAYSYNSFDETQRGGGYFGLDGVYQHDFGDLDSKKENGGGKKGPSISQASVPHNLKFELSYRTRGGNETTINELWSLDDVLIGGNKNIENGPAQRLQLKLDYTMPVGEKDKFEAGLQTRNSISEDNTELWLYDTTSRELVIKPEYTNNTNYYRNIYAAYALYAGYFGKFGYQAGLRTEYTNRKVETLKDGNFLLDRWDLFPTVHVSYNLPKDHQIMASYSRRIDRPRGWELEPFITWQDQYNVRQGNPELKPEYIDSYDGGYLMKFNDNSLSLEGYYRVTNNKVERVSSVYQDSIVLNTVENVGKDYSLGIEAMLNIAITKWWDLNASGNLFNYKIEGTLYDAPFSRTSTNWNSRVNNTFRLWKNGQLQLTYRYNSPTVTAQGKNSGFYQVDGAFKIGFMDNRLSANLQVSDILGTAKREHIQEGQDLYIYSNYDPVSPMVNLTLTYRFNNYKINRKSGSNGGSEDDEL